MKVLRSTVAVLVLVCAASVVLTPAGVLAQNAPEAASWMCRVKLISEAEPDMTSIDSILESITKPGMTDEEKCIAVHRFVHRHRFWAPSSAPVENGRPVYDPMMIVNCFPALICQQDAAVTSAFWAGLGYDVRYWQLGGHTTGEVFYGGKWRNFDATFGRYRRGKDGGVGDVTVNQGGYKPGRSYVPSFDDYEIGHRMDLTLRRGETFTRYWSPLSKTADYWRPGSNGEMPDDRRSRGRRDVASIMRYKPYQFDTRGGGFSNGLWVFEPDLSDGRWAEVFESAENVAADADSGLLHPREPGRPAELIWRMRTPYIMTGAWVEGDFLGGDGGGLLKVFVSTNNGATWREIGSPDAGRGKVALGAHVAGRFAYLLKLTMQPDEGRDVGVRNLKCTTVVQLNPFSLPALQRGNNRIQLALGEQLETMTIYPNLQTSDYRAEVFRETNIKTAREQLQERWITGLCASEGGKESTLVYRVTAPGEIRCIRWGGRIRAAKIDFNEMSYSTDGNTWQKQPFSRRWTFPESKTRNLYEAIHETTQGFPQGTKTVYLKYRFKRPVPKKDPADLHIANAIRIDVDYLPKAKTGPAPVEVTYCWQEGEKDHQTERTHTEIARSFPHAYSINVADKEKPLMKWVRTRIVKP